MHCLLVAATAQEVSIFLDHYRNTNKPAFVDIQIDVLISGVGLVATTYHLTRQVSLKRPDLVIQAGVAGCFHKSISLGSIVAVQKDRVADEGVVEDKEWKSLFDLKLTSPHQYPFRQGWLVNPDKGIMKRNKYKSVNAVSVNQVTTGKQTIDAYIKKYNPVVESMEGAALHYCCLHEKIPFLQLRSISNYIGERNKAKWKMKEAIVNLNKELIRLLEAL